MPAQLLPLVDFDEDRLSPRNFTRLAAYIYDEAGIKLPPGKATMLEGRLRRRLRPTGAASLDEYCDHLFEHGRLAQESVHLINAITTNKTDFYREPRHFDYMRETALPALIGAGVRKIRAWSAACSTGAEPYTIAMELDAFLEQHRAVCYGILATDIDTDVLETARKGIFPAEQLEPVPAAIARKHIHVPRDHSRGDVRIAPALRASVGFAQLNLMDPKYPVGDPMHLIFCRNVLIYFDKPTQIKVVSRLIECLSPDGYLFLGHSESIAGYDLPLVQVSNTIFQRVRT